MCSTKRQLFRSHRTEVGKVKAQALVVLIRTGLVHMVAQHLAQGSLQQMGARMVAGNGAAAADGSRRPWLGLPNTAPCPFSSTQL